ncbi:hypothetical protein [Streptomyces cyaneofuscatus]|uniref:hypothetical protein n=1 Tax=Streptomyces cyaneofuscatus TaxID=66883 RepID=UPI00339FEB6A
MRRPVAGEVHVHYGQIYVLSDPDGTNPGFGEAFAGQSGGLCGAAVSGALCMVTGLHTGSVGFTVEVHDEEPPLAPEWEDVVEVSFRPVSEDTSLVQWGGEAAWALELPVTDYRVRYSARGMDQGRDLDTRTDKEPQADRYLLQFWPAPPRPDRVIRETARIAAYWHGYARGRPAPPAPEQRAEAERLARQAEERAAEERRLHYERWQWGGRLPSEALRGARQSNVLGLLTFDSDLVHTLGAADPEVRHTVALLAARRACEAAGLTGLPWVAGALAALEAGRPLPPPFDDPAGAWETLRSDPRVPDTSVVEAVPPERTPYQPPTARARRSVRRRGNVPPHTARPPPNLPAPLRAPRRARRRRSRAARGGTGRGVARAEHVRGALSGAPGRDLGGVRRRSARNPEVAAREPADGPRAEGGRRPGRGDTGLRGMSRRRQPTGPGSAAGPPPP